MASIHRQPNRRFYFAHFVDDQGKQHCFSTKTTNPQKAAGIARQLEVDYKAGRRTRIAPPSPDADTLPALLYEAFETVPHTEVFSDVAHMVRTFRIESALAREFSTRQIFEWKDPKVVSGVYFCVDRGVVVYIGRSCDVASRGRNHVRTWGNGFSKIYFLPVPMDWLNAVEEWFIKKYPTIYNGRGHLFPGVTPA